MRQVVSISLQEETVIEIERVLQKKALFRNKSHLVEYAVKKILGEMEK